MSAIAEPPIENDWRQFQRNLEKTIGQYPGVAIAVGLGGILAVIWLWGSQITHVWDWATDYEGWGLLGTTLLALGGTFLALVASAIALALIGYAAYALAEGTRNRLDDARKIFESDAAQLEKELQEVSELSNLLPIIKYSRLQLDRFYTITLSQAQQSFRNATLAMWVGFFVLVISLARALGISDLGLENTPPTVDAISVASGVVIEVVSALFLMVYRSAIQRFVEFYDRQFRMHKALFGYGIASSMGAPDGAKELIISQVVGLDHLPAARPGAGGEIAESHLSQPK
jgi:hypothetical protein